MSLPAAIRSMTHIIEADVYPGQGADMCNARAHLSCADDTDF